MPNYENAFDCEDCPEANTKKGCPAWVEYSATNGKEEKIVKGCLGQELIPVLVNVIRAANGPAAEMSLLRNELNTNFNRILTVAKEVKTLGENNVTS